MLTLVVIPVAYLLLSRVLARMKAWRDAPDTRLHPAARIAGLLIAVGLVGWFAAVASAFGQTVPAAGAPATGLSSGALASRVHETEAAQAPPAPLVLTFEDALERALTGNQALKVTEEQVRVGRARVSEARTAFLPSVDLTFLYTPTQRFPLIQIPGGVFGPDPQTFEAGFTRENLMQIDVSQPLYTGGRLASAYGIQAAAFDASRLQLDRARQALHLQVVQAFYAVLMHEQGIRVAAEAIALAERQMELAGVRFEAGSVARLDVLRAEVELANARARRIQARAALETSHQALRTLLGLPQSQPLQVRGTLDAPVTSPGREALTAALASRPDLRAFGARLEMATHAVSLANAQWKPSLALTGNLMYQEDGLSSLWKSDNQSYTLGLALRVPLFAAPRAAAQRTVAEAERRQADHGLRAALDAGHLEIESAWTDLQSLAEVVTMQEKALELARESVAIAQVSYENGVITSAELTDAQVALLQTESLLMQAKYDRIVAAARARFAAGIE
jgi:outer membrane protein